MSSATGVKAYGRRGHLEVEVDAELNGDRQWLQVSGSAFVFCVEVDDADDVLSRLASTVETDSELVLANDGAPVGKVASNDGRVILSAATSGTGSVVLFLSAEETRDLLAAASDCRIDLRAE